MSDTTPDTGTEPTPEAEPQEPSDTPDPAALTADLEKWKAQARKHEERAKANANAAKELEQVRQASMSDQEKAVEIARQQARAEVAVADALPGRRQKRRPEAGTGERRPVQAGRVGRGAVRYVGREAGAMAQQRAQRNACTAGRPGRGRLREMPR